MYEVTVQDTFSSGHYLRDSYGKCENPHGHNYRVLVTLVGEELEPNGHLLSFELLSASSSPPSSTRPLDDQRPRAVHRL